MPELEPKLKSSSERVLLDPLLPALGVGAAAGTCPPRTPDWGFTDILLAGALGVAYGTVAGVLVLTPRPLLYSSLSGLQWFCAGSTYFCMSAPGDLAFPTH